MNSRHRIPLVIVSIVLLAAPVGAQAGRQGAPPAGGQAGAGGRLDARRLCDIGAKSRFVDPVNKSVPKWQAEEAACYGDRALAGDARTVHFIVHGTKASDPEIRNTIQIYFTAAEGVMVTGDDLTAIAIPLLRALYTAAGEEAPADLIRDVGQGVQGRMGSARVPVETAFGRGYYRIVMYFPGRTIE